MTKRGSVPIGQRPTRADAPSVIVERYTRKDLEEAAVIKIESKNHLGAIIEALRGAHESWPDWAKSADMTALDPKSSFDFKYCGRISPPANPAPLQPKADGADAESVTETEG